ncbi:MAG: hypothetical protein WDZ53_04925, partial [Balneolales bacterium]
ITDLGHRANQPIEDILSEKPPGRETAGFTNFFSAARILPSNPVTLRDLRKLLMDVSIEAGSNGDDTLLGVKNAWISMAKDPEVPLWAYRSKSELSDKARGGHDPIAIDPLYEILLEFEYSEKYGDLNSQVLLETMAIANPVTARLHGVEITIEIRFARWDDPLTDEADEWAWIRDLDLSIRKVPSRYSLKAGLDEKYRAGLSGTGPTGEELNVEDIEAGLNDKIKEMTAHYRARVDLIIQIVSEAEKRIHANRNLCEDFSSFNALKIEGIAVCADIELHLEANVETVQAEIFHQIASFLSPPVTFHSLAEMMDMDIPVENIFEGPLLRHGFLMDEELDRSERKESIYVSDLVQLIMNIEGVEAVKHIEIANIPHGNEENIPSRSVQWCLQLAHDHNYVPRLSISDSKITFFKENLPYTASKEEVYEKIRELESDSGSSKIKGRSLDLKFPKGEARGLYQFRSIQEDFPVTYGVGYAGLPPTASRQRKGETRQLKGYLTFFDQLLANYLYQLSNVRELFAMNAGDDDHPVDRTYFAQAIAGQIPDGENIFAGGLNYGDKLQDITESPGEFAHRRNKFLDHLMARFAEQFTDYATLTYRLAGMDAKRDLIQDKLTFLNAYPQISSGRGTAFNYTDHCKIWHVENKSGLEKRASLQVGIDETGPDKLFFTDAFKITGQGDQFGFQITGPASELLAESPQTNLFAEEKKVRAALEQLIAAGQFRENFIISEDDGKYFYILSCNGVILAVSTRRDFASEQDAGAGVDALIEVLKEEFYANPGSNRNNYTAPVSAFFDIKTELNGTEYKISYALYDTPYRFEAGHLLLEGELTGEAQNQISAEQELEEQKEEFIWSVITSGGRSENYRMTEEDNEELQLFKGRFGGTLGVARPEGINTAEAPENLTGFFYKTFLSNEGMHLVEHLLLRPKYNNTEDEGIRDELMSIQIDPDCAHCQLDNPYRYVATVVLPYWQGRFGNMDFRTFFERKIRTESPAHVFLKICWVSNRHLSEFERCYKRWLTENARTEKDPEALSAALNDLIELLENLRNIYPVGRLHDCEESDTLEDSIILNNTILGSA